MKWLYIYYGLSVQWIRSITTKTDVEEYIITWKNEIFCAYTFYIFGKQDDVGVPANLISLLTLGKP